MIARELLTRLGFKADLRSAESYRRALKSVRAAAILTATATAAIGGAMLVMARETAAAGDQLAKTADKLGITTDALQELRYAAERSGVASGTLDMALQRMTRRLSEAGRGGGEALKAIDELGLSASELAAMVPEDAVNKIADALAGVPNQADRVRLAFKFFDSEGVALVNMMQDGSEAVNQLREDFRALGGGISTDGARNAEAFTDAMGDMQIVVRNLRYAVGEQLMPVITELVTGFTEWFKVNQDVIRQGLARAVAEIVNIFDRAWRIGKRFIDIGMTLASTFDTLEGSIIPAAAALLLMRKHLGNVMFILKAGGLLLALEDLSAWFVGDGSLIGELLGPYDDFAAALSRLSEKISELLGMLGVPKDMADQLGALSLALGALLGYRAAVAAFGIAATGMGTGLTALAVGLTSLAGSAALKGLGILARVAGIATSTAGLAAIATFAPTAAGVATLDDPGISQSERDRLLNDAFAPNANAGASAPVITNTINMELPLGTSQSQADYVREQVAPHLDRLLNDAVGNAMQNYTRSE